MNRILEIFAALIAATADDDTTALLTELEGLYADLPDAELAETETALLALFDSVRAGEVEGVDARNVEALRTITTGVENVRALAATRIEEATEVDAAIAELEAQLAADADASGDEPSGADEGAAPAAADDAGGEPAGEATDEGAAPAEDREPEPVTAAAARPALGAAAGRQPAAVRPRTPATPEPRDPHVIIQSATGGQLDSMVAAADYMANEFNRLGRDAGKRNLVTLAAQYPEDQTMREHDTSHNGRIMDAIVAAGQDPASWQGDASLVAAGWCTPSPVDYSLILQAVADRPVFDFLPKVGMERMGLRIPVSPSLSAVDVTPGSADAAVGVMLEDDVDDEGFSKPIQAIDCPTWEDFRAYAVTRRLKFKNGAAMAYPENVAQWNGLTAAAFARKADSYLLGGIKLDAGTTRITEPDQVYGAAIDVIELILRLGAQMRSAERTGGQARLRAALPAWIVDLLQADLARSGRATYTGDSLVVARNKIIDMLTSANINPGFYLDTPVNPATGALSGPTQLLARQTQGGTALGWPCKVQFGLWFEGQFAVGDPGELNLGVVRDSTLNARNEFENFFEKWETVVAHRGPEALWVTQTVAVTGAYQAPIDGDITCETQAS